MKSVRISLILNSIIVVFVLFATICMSCGFEFMGHTTSLTAEGINVLQFYTVQSNLIMGIMAAVYVVYDILIIIGKIDAIPAAVRLLKLTSTVGVSVTLLTVVLYLTPITGENAATLYMNANLFFHLLVPLLSIVTWLVFERGDNIRFRWLWICILPTLIYGIFYAINAFSHTVEGKVPYRYDWYGFVQGGVGMTILVFACMLAFVYGVTYVLWAINKPSKK